LDERRFEVDGSPGRIKMRSDKVRQMWSAALRAMGVALFVGLVTVAPGNGLGQRAQQQTGAGGRQGSATQPTVFDQPNDVPDSVRGHMDAERMRMLNDDRHKRLSQDVDKLLALTNELKADVDKTNKDELSVEVIRKAGEIEKLAHDVQSRMKN
jgi:hypothetical protein